jgi:hypothetical protein
MNRERDVSKNQTSANPVALLAIGVGVVMLLAGGYYIWQQQQQEIAPEPKLISLQVERIPIEEAPIIEPLVEEALPVFEAVPERTIVLPPETLDGSDPFVKKAVADFGSSLSEWLMASQQVRKWVLAIDLMADGNLLKQDRPLNLSIKRYEAVASGEDVYLPASGNDTRTNLLISAITALDAELLAYYYQKWSPLLEKGYQELGKRGTFHGRLIKAIDRVTAVAPLTVEPLLEKKGGVMYRYVDIQLESASDIEKLMWRLGSENSNKLQVWLKQLQEKLPK